MGYSAYQIYSHLSAASSAPMVSAGDVARTQAPTMQDISTDIGNLTQRMNSAWVGDASEVAQAGAGPLGGAAQSASEALNTHMTACYSQASALDTAKASVQPVSPTAPQNNIMNEIMSTFGPTDLDNQIAQYQASSEHNVQVYNSYNYVTGENAGQMPANYGELPVTNTSISVVNGPSAGLAGSGYRYSSTEVSVNTGTSGYGGGGYAGAGGAGEPYGSGTVTSGAGRGPVTGGGTGWGEPVGGNTTSAGTSGGDPAFGAGPDGYPDGAGGFADEGGAGGFGSAGAGGGAGASAADSAGRGVAARGTVSSSVNENSAGRAAVAGIAPEEGTGTGGPAVGGTRDAEGDEDKEHRVAEYLEEPDSDSFWGIDTPTVPPVLGL